MVHAHGGKDSSNVCINTYGDKCFKCDYFNKKCKPEETAHISRRHHWIPREMASEKGADKFCLLSRSGWCFWLYEANFQPIRGTTQIWVVMRHQYGISALVPRKWSLGETSGGVATCRLFFWATYSSMILNSEIVIIQLPTGFSVEFIILHSQRNSEELRVFVIVPH